MLSLTAPIDPIDEATDADKHKNLDLRLLRQFLVVCDSTSLTAASVKLGLSTPAVSQLIMRLERDLNVVLLERSNHGTRLTPAGAVMRDRARALVENEDDIIRELAAYRTKLVPRLRVYVLSSVASIIMPAIVRSLHDAVGELEVNSGHGDYSSEDFLRGDIDILISTEPLDGLSRIQSLHLCDERMIAIVPAWVPAEQRTLVALSEQLPFIRCTRTKRLGPLIDRYLSEQGVSPPYRMECGTAGPQLEFVKHGLGWTILPPLCFSYVSIDTDKIAFVELPQPLKPRSIYLASSTDALLDLPQRMAEQSRRAIADTIEEWRVRPGCKLLAASVSVKAGMLQPLVKTPTNGRADARNSGRR